MRVLETARLQLRTATGPIARDELEAAYRVYVDELEGETFTLEEYEQEVDFDIQLAQNSLGQHFGRPAIVIKENNRRIGHCVFLPRLCTPAELSAAIVTTATPQHTSIEAEIGWAISDQYRNRGFATEAAQALVDYGFTELGLARIVAFTEKDNDASLRVMRKIGMRVGQSLDTDIMVGVITHTAT
jgi:RimJ/RimL family protein N-acetyltransferase